MNTMLIQFALCILHFAFCASLAWAARPYTPVHPDPVLEPWRWRSFPELNGLGLRCMAEAKDKAMWFGVDDGARRYDGIRWTAYTEKDGLYGGMVDALCATRDGSVYAGTSMGISCFKDGKWRRVFPPEGDPSTGSGQALPWPVNDLMEARDGGLWAGTDWGALRLSQEGATLYTTEQMGAAIRVLAPSVRLSIVPDAAAPARPWGEGIGVRVVQKMGLPGWTARRDIPAVIWELVSGGPGEAVGLEVGDRILAVDGQPGVAQTRLDGPASTPVKLTVQRKGNARPFEVAVTCGHLEGTFRDLPVYDVYEDRDGAIWLGLMWGEIIRYAPFTAMNRRATQHSEWRLYTEKDGLDLGWRPRIAQTRDGVLYKVSDHANHGVNRMEATGRAVEGGETKGQAWTPFRLSDLGGTDANPSLVETRDGTLWVGGNGHYLHACRKGAWTVYTTTSNVPIPLKNYDLLETSDGALWLAGLGKQVARLDYGTARWTTYEGLLFQCETPDGSQWFVSQDGGVVRREGREWTRYGVEDGLMDAPLGLIATRQGVLWAFGSHDSTAATARLDPLRLAGARSGQASTSSGQAPSTLLRAGGMRWSLQTHPRLDWGILPRAVYESSDGALWFGATAGSFPERGHLAGVLRFDPSADLRAGGKTPFDSLALAQSRLRQSSGQAWTHYSPPEGPGAVYGIGQTADGLLYFGGFGLFRFDGRTWTAITEPPELTSVSDAVYAAKGDLYVGTRYYGLFHYNGKTWTRYDVRDGLADNEITGIFQTPDGSIWAVSGKGISRFDGQTWQMYALPLYPHMVSPKLLQPSREGPIWINNAGGGWWGRARPGAVGQRQGPYGVLTVRYQPDATPPETEITVSLDQVSQPGNTVLAWTGVSPYKATPDEEIRYSYRLDGGAWSPFSGEKNKVFLSLPGGSHTFEVRARDRDFNVDPTPAAIRFTVVPPVWRQPWFILLMGVMAVAIGFQTARVIRRDRRLQRSNEDLRQEITQRRRAEEERTRLDERLQQLRYLYRLREDLGTVRSSDEVFQNTGEALMEVLSPSPSAGVLIELDGRAWRFGETPLLSPRERGEDISLSVHGEGWGGGGVRYERGLSWGGKQRGSLSLFCGVELSESQERTLLDETAGQISAALEARELEAQILQSARLVSLGQMAAGVAHELNQPLDVISTVAGDISLRLAEDLKLSPKELRTMMQDVLEMVEHMAGAVEHLRVFSRDKSGEPGVLFDVNEVVHAGLKLIGTQLRSHGVVLQLDLAEGLPAVNGHPHQMEQVLLNLLRNARDALDEKEAGDRRQETGDRENRIRSTGLGTGPGSRPQRERQAGWPHGSVWWGGIYRREVEWEKGIWVRTRCEAQDRVWVVLEVEDSGVGMDEAIRSRLFEPFFTTKPADRGTGLGLSISYAIVRDHGGQIRCESRRGEGTMFRVMLPASEA